jgi:Tfp pilus assembly protein FimT
MHVATFARPIFALAEIAVVIAVITLLAIIALFGLFPIRKRSHRARILSSLCPIHRAVDRRAA